MGTSKSSSGPGKDVPLVPSWVPPLPPDLPPDAPPDGPPDDDGSPEDGQPPEEAPPEPTAPAGRFGAARRALGEFAATGDRAALQRGLGHYVGKGLGGAPTATRRLAGTARTAGALYNVLQGMAAGQTPDAQLDPAALRGLPPKAIADRIIDAIRRTDGTQDTEATRQALAHAQSDLLEVFPDADLTDLTTAQIELWVERFLGHDICNQLQLNIGQAILSKAPSPDVGVRRFADVRDYVMAVIEANARGMKDRGQRWTTATSARFAARVIRETMDVFEGYCQ
jgi:hypothetical protein